VIYENDGLLFGLVPEWLQMAEVVLPWLKNNAILRP